MGAGSTKKSWRSHFFLLKSSDFRKREVEEGDRGTNHFMGDFFPNHFLWLFLCSRDATLLFKHDWKETHGTHREVHMKAVGSMVSGQWLLVS